MGVWDVVAVLAGAVVVTALLYLWRLRSLASRTGSFECGLSWPGRTGWYSGIGVFGARELRWYRLISLLPTPRHRFDREGLEVTGTSRRSVSGLIVDVTCLYRGQRVGLAMPVESYTALVSWLESAAPADQRNVL